MYHMTKPHCTNFPHQLNDLYRMSPLAPWYDHVEIDAFHPGSVLVDYILHLTDISDTLDTTDLKQILNRQTNIGETLDKETGEPQAAFLLGNFSLDPAGTDFIGEIDAWIHKITECFICCKCNV